MIKYQSRYPVGSDYRASNARLSSVPRDSVLDSRIWSVPSLGTNLYTPSFLHSGVSKINRTRANNNTDRLWFVSTRSKFDYLESLLWIIVRILHKSFPVIMVYWSWN